MMPIRSAPEAFRLRYELIPRPLGTGRVKTTLDVLIANPQIDEASLDSLSRIEWLNWHFSDLDGCADMSIHVHVPKDVGAVRAYFDNLEIEYWVHEPIDLAVPLALRTAIVSSDIDVVLAADPASSVQEIEPGLSTVVATADEVTEFVDVYVRGFDVPWSSNFPLKDYPWTAFYPIAERTTFFPLLAYDEFLKQATAQGREALRVMIHNTLPNLYFGRDRLLFYQMQQRSAERARYERQHFEFETAYHLNHFYLSLYSALDQIAIMVNALLNLGLPEKSIGATYETFRKALKTRSVVVYGLFTDADFADISERVNLLRHQAAHRRPLMPTRIVSEPDHVMSDVELDEKIAENGWEQSFLDGLDSGTLRDSFVETLRAKARLAAMETVAEQVVVVVDEGNATHIIYPDPNGDLEKFLGLLNRVLKEMPAQTPQALVKPPPQPAAAAPKPNRRQRRQGK